MLRKLFFITTVAVAVELSASTARSSAAEQAMSADAFVDTVGVNVHLHYTRSPYYLRFPEVEKALLDLGIRHLRDGAIDTTLQAFYDHLTELARHGIKTTFIFDEKATPDFIRTYSSRVPGSLEAYEPPNEFNQSKDPAWDQTIRTFQKMLYTTVKSDPSLAKYPVIGPSITSFKAYSQLGDVSADMDYGNLHNYFGGRNPGTPGWGPNGYGSYAYNQQNLTLSSATRPTMTTETGYCDGDTPNGSTPEVNAIYEPRLFLEQHLHGIVRTIQYELLDEGGVNTFGGHCGLLTADLKPKPSYHALKSMIGLLADPGPSYKPAPLDVSVSPSDSTLPHVVFGKRDGSYVVALWVETSSFDVPKRQRLQVATRSVTVALPHGTRSGTAYTYDADGFLHGRPITIAASGTTLRIDDHVTFLKLDGAP